MPVGCHHLAHGERCQINALLYSGLQQREIAQQFVQDPGTISRKMSQNRGQRVYRHKQAHGKAMS